MTIDASDAENGRHSESENVKAKRGRTAMFRHRCSRPIAVAVADGLIADEHSVFDFGCGLGGDVRYLAARGIKASGWDPCHNAGTPKQPADVVTLSYVLNVIENPGERSSTLLEAFSLAKKVLVVAVRVDKTLEGTETYSDGFITDRGTFQKIYNQDEFRQYVGSVLGLSPYMAAPGIAYVFANQDMEGRYLANRAFTRRLEYRTDVIEEFGKDPLARQFVKLAARLGRIPRSDEFEGYPELLERFGSQDRIQRLTLRKVDRARFEGSRIERKHDILTYFAIRRLQGLRRPRLNDLPASVRADIRAIWNRFEELLAEAEAFLFSMGRPDEVRAACMASAVGKLLPSDIYAHRSAEDDFPPLLRLIIHAARRLVGELTYDVIKIATDGRAVSFLSYPEFEKHGHPALSRSVRVYLPRASVSVRDYSTYLNPPILHRKETLVSQQHPDYQVFCKLSESEERAGLLSAAEIGTQVAWESLLAARRLAVKGHELISTA